MSGLVKSGQGEQNWKEFFALASAALAIIEKTPPVPGFEGLTSDQIIKQLAHAERKLRVLDKLNGFAIATDQIIEATGQGAYHLVILDSKERQVYIFPFAKTKLDEANQAYARIEARANNGESIEAVLVSAGPINALRKAYPNYFLDTQIFINKIRSIIYYNNITKKMKY